MKKKLKDMVVGNEFLIEHTKHFKIKTVVDYVSKKYLVVMQERNPILFHLGVCGSEEYEMIEPELEYLYEFAYRNNGSEQWNISTILRTLKKVFANDSYKLLRKFHPVTLEEIKQ